MKKIILWSVVGVLIVGIAAAAFWWLRRPQVITLNDGTKLTLLGVEYGKHHKYPVVKVKTAPQNARRRFYGGPVSFDTPADTLVAWVLCEHKPNQWPNYQALAYDKAETACVGNWAGGNSRQISPTESILGIHLDAFPRREHSFYLRFMSWGNGGQRVSKEQFVISNPVRGKFFPNWTPEPLPDTQSDGDLDVTLTKLSYNASFNRGMGTAKPNDPMNQAVFVAFHTEQNGVVVTNWEPVRIETSDATGNDVQNNSWSTGRDDDGDATMTYQWGLWPDEPAWKLRVEMSQTSGFSNDELWSVTNVPVQSGSWQDLWNNGFGNRRTPSAFAETTLNGVHLKIFPALQITDQNFGNGQKQGGVRIVANPDLPEGFRLTVKATDEQGRELQSWGPNAGGGNYVVQLPDIRNAKTLNFTIALHKSRFVEFTVKPTKQ